MIAPGDATFGLAYADGILHLDGLSLAELGAAYGTPSLVYSLDRVRQNARELSASFRREVSLFYSCKACTLGAVIATVRDEGLGVEVCSAPEYQLAISSGVPSEAIVWNAVALTDEDAKSLCREPVRLLGINTDDDLERVSRHACRLGKEIPIALRLHPEGVDSEYIGRGTRLGYDVADGDAMRAARAALSAPGIRLAGIHSHTQVLRAGTRAHRQVLASMVRFAAELFRETGHQLESINLGGGIAGRSKAVDLGAWARDLAEAADMELGNLAWRPRVMAEPGRALVDDAAVGLARLLSRRRAAGSEWWILDHGSHVLMPFGERRFPLLPVEETEGPRRRVSVGDRTSSFSGVFLEDAELPDVPLGGLVAFEAVGAYTQSVAQQFMFEMPAIVLVENGVSRLCADAESATTWARRVGCLEIKT